LSETLNSNNLADSFDWLWILLKLRTVE